MAKTKIEWTEHSWSPVTGCTKISPGCKNCYAERMARRLAGRHGYPEAPHHFDVTLHPDRLGIPLKRKKPTMYFVCSMSDLFHEDVPYNYVVDVFAVMHRAPQHTFQILTKRPARMLDFLKWYIPSGKMQQVFPRVWGGVSVENPDYLWRVEELLKTPFAVRFVSCEPLLSQIDLSSYLTSKCLLTTTKHLQQIIVGCESGPSKRPMVWEWARDLKNQCQSAGIPFFFKQAMIGGKMVKLPELDGKQWAEMPECQ